MQARDCKRSVKVDEWVDEWMKLDMMGAVPATAVIGCRRHIMTGGLRPKTVWPRSRSTQRSGIESIFEQEILYAGAHHEIDKLIGEMTHLLATGPHHRFPKLHGGKFTARCFIDDTYLAIGDCVGAIDETDIGLS